MRRLLLLLIAILIIAGGIWYLQFGPGARNEPDAPQYETIRVGRGLIASTVNATGSIEPVTEVNVAFQGQGIVDSVHVDVGQSVVSGQLLAELESTDLTLALAQAMATLEINQAQLAKLLEPPSVDDIAAARAAVEVAQAGVAGADAALLSAQAAYRDLLAGSSAEQQEVNLAQVRQAEAEVKRAQQAYNEIRNQSNAGALPQAAQLEQATLALDVARTQAALAEEPVDEAQTTAALNQIAQAEITLRQAQSNLITAQNNLKTLLEGPDARDVEIAQSQVQQAQLSILQAENNLESSRLVAPLDGVISLVSAKAGEQAPAGTPAFRVTDLSRLQMEVLVDEIDIRQLALGQPVRIRVDALPDIPINGQVTEISPTAEDVGGVIAYRVTVVPEVADGSVRAGMSATAFVTTAQVEDVVLVPNRYIQLDRENGRAFVYRMIDGAPQLQEVELGLRSERDSQILAGVTDGDELALVTRDSEDALRGVFFGGE